MSSPINKNFLSEILKMSGYPLMASHVLQEQNEEILKNYMCFAEVSAKRNERHLILSLISQKGFYFY